MRKTGYDVSMCGQRREAGNVQEVARVGGPKDGTIGERGRDGVGVTLSVDDVCMFQDEVARGAGVSKGVLCGSGCLCWCGLGVVG